MTSDRCQSGSTCNEIIHRLKRLDEGGQGRYGWDYSPVWECSPIVRPFVAYYRVSTDK